MQKNYFRYRGLLFLAFMTVLSLLAGKAVAQTTLAAGDLSIVSINSNTADAFTFVTWVPLQSNTEIKFTDNGFHSGGLPTASLNFRDQEQTVTWRNNTGANIAAGTVVTIGLTNPATASVGEIVSSLGANGNAAAMTLTNNSGDHIFAYQGTGATAPTNNVNSNFSGTVIFAIGFSGWNVASTGWVTSGTISGSTSYLPSTVTGTSNVFLGPNVAGAQYNGATSGLASYADYKAAIANPANWTLVTNSSGVITPFPVPTFSAGAVPVVTGNPPNRTICLGANTSFPATVSNATGYQWQENAGSGFANLSNGGVYSGATTATLTITGATAGMSGYTYRLVATGAGGSATTNAGTLTVINITAAASQTNVSCNGGSNGTATVVPSGGIAPYSYSWSPSGGTGATASGLAAGNYTVTITDNLTCQTTRNFTITEPVALAATTSQTNVSCNGGSNGTATVTPSGGTPGYTYSWVWNSGGGAVVGTTATITGRPVGSYTVTVTDANSCSITRNVTIVQPSAINAGTSQTNIACNGGATGALAVTPSGGTPGYTYLWSNGATTSSISGLTAGAYSVTITDANACTATRNFTITQPAAITATTAQTNVSCNGGTNGTATVTPTGGAGSYTYSWAPSGGTGASATGLAPGTYTVTITDANACSIQKTVTITQPAAFAVGTSQANVSCNGGTNGTATVSVSGATGPYTYSWSPSGGTAATASGLAPGTYTVTITDANSCTATRTFTITQPTAITATTAQTNVSCNGGSNGTATVIPTGGAGAYTYSWSPSGGTGASATGLAPGNYTVTITDANACQITRNFTITQPSAITATTAQTNVSCNGGSNGTATVTPTGGAGAYTYSWSPSGGTGATASGLAAGTYTVTITDANTCQTTRTVTITQPASAVSGTTVVTNISCNGGSNGAINLTPAGGTGPYTFNWGGGITTEDRTGLVAGTYTVTITDVNGCTGTASATVTQPAAAVSGTTVVTNISCNGGSNGAINLTPTGGTGPYTFNWGGGITTEDRTGLAAGTYTVTITDVNGCTGTASATVTQPTAITATTAQTNVSCNGGSNGTATVNPTGGAGSYTYSWAPSGGTGASATGLAPGTYTVTITDANACSIQKTVTITQPAAFAVGTSQTNVSCNGGTNGTATVSVSGATGPYTYSWSPSGGTAATASGLAPGAYTVTITDANTCQTTRNFTITQPTAITATTAQTNVSCNGGSNGTATVIPTGGAGAYTYSWAPSGGTAATASGLAAGTYTVTITDANACQITRTVTITQPAALAATPASQTNVSCNGGTNGSATVNVTGGTGTYTYSWSPSGGTAATATGLQAGTYTVTATDANGCTATQSFTITQPAALVATAGSQTNISCNGGTNGSATVNVTGGTGTYTYSWSPSGGTAATASGLASGTYTVTATDANGCTATQSFTITQPAAITATTSQTNIVCNGGATGSASVTATGGTGAYTYAWSPSGGTAATATGLAAGNYAVTITDANGCSIIKNFIITEAAAINVTSQPAATSVIEGTDATFSVTASNATGYQWQVSTNGTTWTDIADGGTNPVYSGATTNTLTLAGVPITFDGYLYRAEVSSSSTCSVDSDTALLTVTPDLNAKDFSRIAVTIYPNPASSQVFIKIPEISNYRNCSVAVYDLNGRVVIQKRLSSESEMIDIANLQQGVYIFNITSDSAKTTKRVVKY